MSEVKHSTIETNGIRMHLAEQGAGPLVLPPASPRANCTSATTPATSTRTAN
jgi:hypothetical protein